MIDDYDNLESPFDARYLQRLIGLLCEAHHLIVVNRDCHFFCPPGTTVFLDNLITKIRACRHILMCGLSQKPRVPKKRRHP